jgi:hypothetical protein
MSANSQILHQQWNWQVVQYSVTSKSSVTRLQWSRGSMLAFGPQVCGFEPGQSRQIFQGEKILSMPSFGGEVKPSVPCHRFVASKRSLQRRGSHYCWQNYRTFLAHSFPFPARGLLHRCRCGGAWRCTWELPKHRVSTISLRAAVHSCGGSRRGPIEEVKGFWILNKVSEFCSHNPQHCFSVGVFCRINPVWFMTPMAALKGQWFFTKICAKFYKTLSEATWDKIWVYCYDPEVKTIFSFEASSLHVPQKNWQVTHHKHVHLFWLWGYFSSGSSRPNG